jgi:hypothetical protein
MKFDFTLETYQELLKTLFNTYKFSTFREFLSSETTEVIDSAKNQSGITPHASRITNHAVIILRHDVDRLPQNALRLAQLEHDMGIHGTYYFRIVPQSYNLEIMQKIAELGHEIGYHYEDVDLVVKRDSLRPENIVRKEIKIGGVKRDEVKFDDHISSLTYHASRINDNVLDAAYDSFCKNLEIFRKHFYIKTICMHGSPRSRYDNKLIWTKYDYRNLGILGEPYLDIDFNEVAYFTDTGRRWNADKSSIRDKVYSLYKFNFKKTPQIINNVDILPEKIMFNIHPQRWNGLSVLWVKELVFQNVKNVFKYVLNRYKQNL